MCIMQYKNLAAAEKQELWNAGYSIKTDFEDLMKCVRNVDSKCECLALFAEAEKMALIIWGELNSKVYMYDNERYTKCRAKLNEAIKAMQREQSNFLYPHQYPRLLECSGRCEHSESRYAKDWDKIIKFDADKKTRMFGNHAFKNGASMEDMLHALAAIGA